MRRTFWLAGLPLLITCLPGTAQSPLTLMPEGSKEIYLGVAAVYSPRANGIDDSGLRVVPLLSAQWSNGVFIDMNIVGMHLSDRADLRYGPLWKLMKAEIGGFVRYRIVRGLSVATRVMYGSGSDHHGLLVRSSANLSTMAWPHHIFGVEAGITLANRAALFDDFGMGENAARPAHQLHSGLRDATLSAHWSWEVDHKITLRSWIEEQKFLGSARSSPRLTRTGSTTLGMMVLWRY